VKENNGIDKELNLPLLEKVKQIDGLEENEKQSILTVIDIALAKKRFKDNLSNLLTT
jgi:hypothetical protein